MGFGLMVPFFESTIDREAMSNSVELEADQALQRAVAAHREGRHQEAERRYRAMLQAQPNHPDANHNLGVLALASGQTAEGLARLKLALDANPRAEQFWVSYIDALIRTEQFDDARQVLEKGSHAGVISSKWADFHRRLQETRPQVRQKIYQGSSNRWKRYRPFLKGVLDY